MFTAHPTSAAIRRRLKPCFLKTSISMYTSFVITGASNPPIFSTRCINFQSLACINLHPLVTHIKELDQQVKELEVQIQTRHGESGASRKLVRIPGIGPITASALVALIGDAKISMMAGRWLPGLDSFRGSTPAAANKPCSASASAAILASELC